MANMHTPERQPGESQEQYRTRQRASRYAATLGRDVETGHPIRLIGLGDQHKAASSRQRLRDSQRQNGRGPKGVFGAGITAAAAKARRDSNEHLAKHPLRDQDGALTFVGKAYDLVNVAPGIGEYVIAGGVDVQAGGQGESFHTVRRIWRGGISAYRGY